MLLMKPSLSSMDSTLEEIYRCIKSCSEDRLDGSFKEDNAQQEGTQAQEMSPPGLGKGILRAKFGLHVLDAAIQGLAPGREHIDMLRRFLWRLLPPQGRKEGKLSSACLNKSIHYHNSKKASSDPHLPGEM